MNSTMANATPTVLQMAWKPTLWAISELHSQAATSYTSPNIPSVPMVSVLWMVAQSVSMRPVIIAERRPGQHSHVRMHFEDVHGRIYG